MAPIEIKYFDHDGAVSVLETVGLISEISDILHGIVEIDHRKIQQAFKAKGWQTQKHILPETNWAWDACKDRVVVSIEFSLIDAVHRDFFRFLMWHLDGKLDAAVYITTTFKEPKFHNVRGDIEICAKKYPTLLPFPILLVGLGK